jgi:hypothetical protein
MTAACKREKEKRFRWNETRGSACEGWHLAAVVEGPAALLTPAAALVAQ